MVFLECEVLTATFYFWAFGSRLLNEGKKSEKNLEISLLIVKTAEALK